MTFKASRNSQETPDDWSARAPDARPANRKRKSCAPVLFVLLLLLHPLPLLAPILVEIPEDGMELSWKVRPLARFQRADRVLQEAPDQKTCA